MGRPEVAGRAGGRSAWQSGTVPAVPPSRSALTPDAARPHDREPRVPHVVVVGGGISGLAAAWYLARAHVPVTVTLLESSPVLGGKLAVSDVAGISVDEGAESFVAGRPEALLLAREVGLESELVEPAEHRGSVWSRGAARRVPRGQFLGVPTDLRSLAASGLISLSGLLRIPLDRALPAADVGEDVAVGSLVGSRLGREVVDRLVEPLLGGVYAGRADMLSMAATMPALFRELRHERSLLAATRRVVRGGAEVAGARRGVPFRGMVGGVGRLPGAVAAALVGHGVQIRTRATVRGMVADGSSGWRLEVGPASAPEFLRADAVVLATPAPAASRLLGHDAPRVAMELGSIEYASVAVVALALRAADVRAPLVGSGMLVPPVEGRAVKALTYADRKWDWLSQAAEHEGLRIIRASLGRYGDESVLQRDDEDLLALARVDLAHLLGVLAAPVDSRVTRWGGALPQYAVGHRARVERIRTGLRDVPTLALCGAAFDGVGVAACVGSAQEAAGRVVRALSQQAESSRG